jgi:starch-binding outer membrane protein, SusD/RagB family
MKMNKNIIIYAASFVVSILCGCKKDFLDQVPKDSITEEVVWGEPNVAQQFVNGIYGNLPSAFDRDYDGWAKGIYLLDGVTDDGDVCMPWCNSHRLQDANFLPSNSPLASLWGIYYGLVRKADVALANLDKVPDETTKKRLKGEAYFLRAFVYHDILRWYGMKSSGSEPTGVPIIDKPLTPQDNFQIPRATYDETVNFILNDLAQAETLLPAKGGTEAGRATKGAVWALQSRVLLYAERWKEAAAAAKKVMDDGCRRIFLISRLPDFVSYEE